MKIEKEVQQIQKKSQNSPQDNGEFELGLSKKQEKMIVIGVGLFLLVAFVLITIIAPTIDGGL